MTNPHSPGRRTSPNSFAKGSERNLKAEPHTCIQYIMCIQAYRLTTREPRIVTKITAPVSWGYSHYHDTGDAQGILHLCTSKGADIERQLLLDIRKPNVRLLLVSVHSSYVCPCGDLLCCLLHAYCCDVCILWHPGVVCLVCPAHNCKEETLQALSTPSP